MTNMLKREENTLIRLKESTFYNLHPEIQFEVSCFFLNDCWDLKLLILLPRQI